MSVSSEVQRTLVKSPPELWAELSDPVALARHLGELGEIHIVATEPERSVDWEAATDGAEISGRVEIAPSGWGTRVTLSASRMIAKPEPEPEPAIEPKLAIEPEPAVEPEVIEVIPELASEPEPEVGDPEQRPGFFARLFRRRKGQSEPKPTVEPEPVVAATVISVGAAEIEEPTLEETVTGEPISEEPVPDTPEIPATDISAELAELEEQTTAVLTGVLDRLGAAHHRPFSRS